MPSIKQFSLSGGEIAPSLYGRVDLDRYRTALRTCRNMIVRKHGGVSNRAGFAFVGEVKNSLKKVRLIPFIFNEAQTYVLEFGDLYMRVFSAGGRVLDGALAIVEIVTPYLEADLSRLRYVQSADILTVVHPSYAPQEVRRLAHDSWTISAMSFAPSISAPTGVTYSAGGDPITNDRKEWDYVVTAVSATEGGEESVGSTPLHIDNFQPTSADPIKITWTAVGGADHYVVYRGKNQVYGFIGTSKTNSFVDDGQSPAYGETPPTAANLFGSTNNFPSLVCYFQQRLVFAATNNDPDRIWMSQSANFRNFGASSPARDDDTVIFTIASRQVDDIRGLIPTRVLLVFTGGAEYSVTGGQDSPITPSSVDPRPHGYHGSAFVDPLIVGNVGFFVQAKGQAVRDLYFDFESDGYSSDELSVLAEHLFVAKTISEWAYSQAPLSVLWAVRDDGILLGLTYLREHQIWAWHRQDTDGTFENLCSVPEGNENALYAVVKRTVNGATKRYIERLSTRTVEDVKDGIFLDSSLSFDGRNETATTMTLSGGVNWTVGEEMDITASASFFAITDVGSSIVFTGVSPRLRVLILSYTSATMMRVRVQKDVPVSLRGVATASWELAPQRFSGLAHLEGKTVGILADGNVHPQVTVVAGAVNLEYPAAVVHVGLPYTSDIETLDLDIPGGETIRDKRKVIEMVTFEVEAARGLFTGEISTNLREWKQRLVTDSYEGPIPLFTGPVEIRPNTSWNYNGRVFLRQFDPLPLTVLSVTPKIGIGE